MANETLGKWHFWLFFIGFNITFFTHAFSGAARHAPPRLYLRPGYALAGLECARLSGVVFMTAGVLVFLVNVFRSARSEKLRETIHGEMPGWNGRCRLHLRPTTFFMFPL